MKVTISTIPCWEMTWAAVCAKSVWPLPRILRNKTTFSLAL